MCMLFAISSEERFEANEYLRIFYKNSDKHPHGWGLAYVDSGDMVISKESLCASDSNYLKEQMSAPIQSGLLMAHIRYATIGNVDQSNCHPFTGVDRLGRRWTLIHNGTIFDYQPLSRYTHIQTGETDSERIFLYIKDKISERQEQGRLGFEERFELLDGIVSDMSKGNKLNLIFTDGKYLYVHTNCRDTLYYLEMPGRIIIATKPLTSENWHGVPFGTLIAYKNGRLIHSGTPHRNEYIESPERIQQLYRAYSNL